jgi:hypothetical protein
MAYTRFNVTAELRKFLKGKKTKVDAETLLLVIGGRYLEALKDRRSDDSVHWLERLYNLEDPRQ